MYNDTYVPGKGPNSNVKLLVLGEAPSWQEVEQLQPFVGPSGRELDRLFIDSGINRNECWLTNVCKYMVPPNTTNRKIPFPIRAKQAEIDIDKQLEELRFEINQINPNCILALGGTALWALTGKSKITNYRGSILYGMSHKLVATYHPAHLIHQQGGDITGYWQRQVMIFDFNRAKLQSEFSEIKRPNRILSVCRNSAQLADFIQRHENDSKLSIDIEAINCIPSCIGIAFTSSEALSIPLWNAADISNIPDSDLSSIWILIANLLNNPNYKKVGQNFKYDEDKIKRLGFVIDKLHSDTMLKAFVINPELPKNLAFNTSIYTEEPYYKDEGSEFNITKQSIDDLFIYNARDAAVTLEIDDRMESDLIELGLQDFYYNFIMQLHSLYLDIENEGFRVSEEKREELIKKYVEWQVKNTKELTELIGYELNTNSPKQVSKLLFETLKLPTLVGTGEEQLTLLLKHCKTDQKRKIIELILDDRRVRKTINQYLLSSTDYDGRMRTTYYLCLETGRTSTGLQEPPIRPMLEIQEGKKKKKKALGMAFQTITKHGDIGGDIRSMLIADDDEVFIQADSSQAEARVVALLSDDNEMLKMYDLHDIHALTASWFFGGTESDYSKKILGYESPQRFAGKTLRHAGHLGASKKRAATELNTQARKYKINFSITEAEAEHALKIFHDKSPSIRKVFHSEVIKCVQKNRILVAPLPYGIDSKIGGKRTFYERMGEELFRQAFSYLPQRAVSDNTKAAALRIRKRINGIRILLESHDSLLFSIKIDALQNIIPIIKEEMEREINFEQCSLPRRSLVIPCDIEIGTNYKDLKKFSFDEVLL